MPATAATRLAYFGTALTEHIGETPEGFLLCRSARLCRSGPQQYRGSELGLDTDDMVTVRRPTSEVLDPAHLASLEGKPICDGHPPQFVTPTNAGWYGRGHVQNVREGEVLSSGERVVVGDLVVTDSGLIDKIKNGVRELSVGYEYVLAEGSDGEFVMRNLRANHIAIVANGRAGSQIRIVDSAPEESLEAVAAQYLGRDPVKVRTRREEALGRAYDAFTGGERMSGEPRSWDELTEDVRELMGNAGEDEMKKQRRMTDDERDATMGRILTALQTLLAQIGVEPEKSAATDEDLITDSGLDAECSAMDARADAMERAARRYLGQPVVVGRPREEKTERHLRRATDRELDPDAAFEEMARLEGERMRGKK